MLKKTKRQLQYETNKVSKVGETITCPICGEQFEKKSYQQAFCCTKCKDAYWNNKKDRHKKGYYTLEECIEEALDLKDKEWAERFKKAFEGLWTASFNVVPSEAKTTIEFNLVSRE